MRKVKRNVASGLEGGVKIFYHPRQNAKLGKRGKKNQIDLPGEPSSNELFTGVF